MGGGLLLDRLYSCRKVRRSVVICWRPGDTTTSLFLLFYSTFLIPHSELLLISYKLLKWVYECKFLSHDKKVP